MLLSTHLYFWDAKRDRKLNKAVNNINKFDFIIPPKTKFRGVYWNRVVRPSVRPSFFCPGFIFVVIERIFFKLSNINVHDVNLCLRGFGQNRMILSGVVAP
jgi:hypothetical protein